MDRFADTECTVSVTVRLLDFSCVALQNYDELPQSGTWNYLPPEVLLLDGRQVADGATDMWSLGVILYILLMGFHPFDPDGNSSVNQVQTRIMMGNFEVLHPRWFKLSVDARDLIQRLIAVDPQDRLTAEEILRHPFVTRWEKGCRQKIHTS